MAKTTGALGLWSAHLLRRTSLPLTVFLLLIELFDELYYGIEGAVLPSLRSDLGLSYTQVGLLLGLPGVLSTFIEPLILLLGDTHLRKRLIIGGGITVAGGALALAQAETFWVALAALMVSYPASGAFVTLSQATLMDLNPGRESQMMARWTVFGSLGNLLGPLLVTAVYAAGSGWRLNYLLMAGLALALALVGLPQQIGRPTAAGGDHERPKPALRGLLTGLKDALRNSGLMRWLVLLEIGDLLMDVFVGYSALYFADRVGMSPGQVGIMMSALMAAGLAANLALIPILERVPGRLLVRVTAVIAGIGYAAWLLAPWLWAKVALAILVRFSTLGWYEVLQGEAYAAVPGRSGTVVAASSVMGVCGGVLIWLIGWVAEANSLQTAMWLLLAGPLALALFTPRVPAQD